MDPVQRPVQRRRERVRHLDELARVVRNGEVPVIVVAVAEMEAQLDIGGHAAADPQEPLENAGAGSLEPGGADALEDRELQPRVPLQRQLVVRHGGEDLVELAQHLRLVDRLDLRLVLRIDERAHRRQRRRQRDLEAHVRRDHPVALELREDRERRQRRVGKAEVAEHDVRRALAVAKPQLGQRAVRPVAGRAHLELGQGTEHGVLPQDPVGSWPRLAVGKSP